jgi:PAS domain S-box-containing protein
VHQRSSGGGSKVFWAWGCVAILGSGALTHVDFAARFTLPAGFALGTLYPVLLLAGAVAYAGWRGPRAIALAVLAALSLGVARGVAQLAGHPGLAHGAALLCEPALSLAAAACIARAHRQARLCASQRLLAPALVGVAALDAVTHWHLLPGAPLPLSLVVVWMTGAPLLLAVQLGASGALERAALERAGELLERRVAEQAARWRAVSELSSDFSFACRLAPGRNLVCEWFSDAFSQITGYAPEEIEGQGWRALFADEQRAALLVEFDALLAGGHEALELPIRTKAGEERWLRVRLTPTGEAAERERGVLGVASDISDRVRAERERRRLDRRLREMQRLEGLGRLTAGIAHDFNNAITVILGNAKLALDELARGALERRRLERLRSAAEYAAALSDRILTTSGRAALQLAPVDLSRVVREMLELLHASLGAKAVLEVELAEDLPPVAADVTQMRQVVVNLVTNAAEALGREGGVIRVRTGVRTLAAREIAGTLGAPAATPGAYAFLEVSDTGTGLAPEARARIFEPFYTTKRSGRGLGLAAVLGIVRAHGGLIRVGGEPGRGTSFEVLLPRSRRHAALPETDRVRLSGQGRVLVVEDDEAVLEVATAFLARAGYEPLATRSARAACDLLADPGLEIDALVLDLELPDPSAREALAELRALRPALPVVLASGYDAERVARLVSDRDGAQLLRKPFSAEEIVESVRRALERRGPSGRA